MRRDVLALLGIAALIGCSGNVEQPINTDAPTDLVYQLIPSGDPLQPLGILLAWNPPSSGLAVSYDVYGRSATTDQFSLRATTTSPSFHDAGLPQLQYFVQALDEQGRQLGSSDTITVDERNVLPAPQGLATVTLNRGVELSWEANAFNAGPDIFDYYRVYSASFSATTGCNADWAVEGTTVSDGFVARNLPNGETRCFAVSAISIDGHESTWSNIRQDTPRYDAPNVVVDTRQSHPSTAGFVFATADTFGLVVSSTSSTADIILTRQSDGSLWFKAARTGVSLAPYGVSPITGLTTIDRAPVSGYADSVKVRAGFGYVARVTYPDGRHYGGIRVVQTTSSFALFDFSYQPQVDSPELLRASP